MNAGLEASPIWVNGRWCGRHEALVRGDDAGLLFGQGAFETIRWVSAGPVALDHHLRRLARALDALGIPAVSASEIREAVFALGPHAGAGEAAVRVVVTAGSPGGGPLCMVSAGPLPASVLARRGGATAVAVHGHHRSPPQHKTLAWLPSLLARRGLSASCEPLLIGPAGDLTEGATSNLFVRRDDGWLTPPIDRCLPGVTRALVMTAAARLGQRVVAQPIHAGDLSAGAEAFITNALL
ncbi:MAG: aminotransferase class IV, partial [Myxococcales bacterium]|nr:aminotransferase class IV [Myxococcales bacterium]